MRSRRKMRAYFRIAPSNNERRKLREPATTLSKSGFIRKVCCSACSRQRSLITDHLGNEPALSSAACLSFFSCLCDRRRRRWCRRWTCVILRLFFLSSSCLRLGSVVRKEGRASSDNEQAKRNGRLLLGPTIEVRASFGARLHTPGLLLLR